jgi:hypothetical protein
MLATCTSSFFWWIPNGTPYVSLISEVLQAMLDKDQSRR